MRKLKTTDVFAFARCLKAIGIKEEMQNVAKEADTATDLWQRGFEAIWAVIDKATERNGEVKIYEFLAGPFEMTAEEVAELDMPVFFQMLKQLAEENDLVGFFKSAAGLMK